jgi:hypothetical protein
MPSNDFHLMIESLHILLLNLKYLPQFEKSYFETIWFINSPTGFVPTEHQFLQNILEVLFNLSPLTSSKYSESSRLPELPKP